MKKYATKYELDKMSKFYINLFAHDEAGDGGDSGDTGDGGKDDNGGKDGNNDDKGGDEGKDKPRTYTDADVDAIVAKKFAKWQKDHEKDLEKAKEEARKYERMTKEQREAEDKRKAEEEAKKKDARIKELENQIATDALRKSVAKDVESMAEGFVASQNFLDLVVVGEDAEVAKKNVEKLTAIILADRKAQEQKRATGTTPKAYGGTGGSESAYDKIVAKYNK